MLILDLAILVKQFFGQNENFLFIMRISIRIIFSPRTKTFPCNQKKKYTFTYVLIYLLAYLLAYFLQSLFTYHQFQISGDIVER